MQVFDLIGFHKIAFFMGKLLKPLSGAGFDGLRTICPQSYPQNLGMAAESMTNQ